MPTTPHVSFKVQNNNLAVTTPQTGVSLVLARTSKGPYDDPSTIVRSITQFRNLFGGEVYENNTEKLSDIERALANGSNLRIIRVKNSGYIQGYLSTDPNDYNTVAQSNDNLDSILTFASQEGDNTPTILFAFDFKVKNDDYTGLKVILVLKNRTYYLDIYNQEDSLIDEVPVITLSSSEEDTRIADVNQFINFLENNKYFTPVFDRVSTISTMAEALEYLRSYDGTSSQETPGHISIHGLQQTSYQVNSNPGSAPTKAEWIASAEAIRDVSDVYQVACSHINDNLIAADVNEVHAAIATIAKECEDWVYYIEVPFYNSTLGRPYTDTELVSLAGTLVGIVGASRYVALFTGGLKLYGSEGNLINNNVIGDVLGLGDSAAQSVGPWYSFSGINRGVVWDANGPVIANYGSPSRKGSMESLAEYYLNVFCNKETPGSGMQTVLWHGFTTQVKQDSFRFLSVVRLVLYIKKNLRPIFEAAIEEPNTFGTWSEIYLRGKKVMDDLVTRQAITEYEWMGDQNASSYEDLQVNNEADVRQGKYKVVIRFREVVPMQDIEVTLSIDKANNSISVTVNS